MFIVCILLYTVAVSSTTIKDSIRPDLSLFRIKPEHTEHKDYVRNTKSALITKDSYPSTTATSKEDSSQQYAMTYTKGTTITYPQYMKNYGPSNLQVPSISKPQFASFSNPKKYYRNAPYPSATMPNPTPYLTPAPQPMFSNPTHTNQRPNYPLIQNAFDNKKFLSGFTSFNNYDYAPFSGFSQNPTLQNPITSSNVHVPIYKANDPGSKIANPLTYDPGNQGFPIFSASYFTPKNVQNTDSQIVDINGKKVMLPVLQLKSSVSDISEYLHPFENQPLLLKSGLSYQEQPNFEFSFETPKSAIPIKPAGTSAFLSPLVNYQQQVIPIQTGGVNQQFPQYKGARVGVNPSSNNNFAKPATNYTPLQYQPQLHFDPGNAAISQENYQKFANFRPEAIREDVEILKKKKPPPPHPEEDEGEDDESYKSGERDSGEYSEDNDEPPSTPKKYHGGSNSGNFNPSTSFPFKAYDEKFGRSSKQSGESQDDVNHQPRYQDFSGSREDTDSEEHAAKYSSDESDDSGYGRHSDEDEEETQRHEKKQAYDPDYELQPKQYKNIGKSIDQEYETSYGQELPKEEYVHVKGVPEVNEPLLKSRKSSFTKPSQFTNSRKNNRDRSPTARRETHDYNNERDHSTLSRKPNIDHNEDSKGYSSNLAMKKSPKIVHEETFEYQKPKSKTTIQPRKKNVQNLEPTNETRLQKSNLQDREPTHASTNVEATKPYQRGRRSSENIESNVSGFSQIINKPPSHKMPSDYSY